MTGSEPCSDGLYTRQVSSPVRLWLNNRNVGRERFGPSTRTLNRTKTGGRPLGGWENCMITDELPGGSERQAGVPGCSESLGTSLAAGDQSGVVGNRRPSITSGSR